MLCLLTEILSNVLRFQLGINNVVGDKVGKVKYLKEVRLLSDDELLSDMAGAQQQGV
jgi:hypothetical protein